MEPRIVDKGWGREVIFADTQKYAGKLLQFGKGNKMSLHFHRDKDETWYVLSGQFSLNTLDMENAEMLTRGFNEGDCLHLPPFSPHQLECLSDGGGTIIEVSTPDDSADNYRIAPGDSQNA
jgi:mannose-6-phosphate isomerase-like protein (cupin superfamily)